MADLSDPPFKPALSEHQRLVLEDIDLQWAHYGRHFEANMNSPRFTEALRRALLKNTNAAAYTAAIRAYLITGVLP